MLGFSVVCESWRQYFSLEWKSDGVTSVMDAGEG